MTEEPPGLPGPTPEPVPDPTMTRRPGGPPDPTLPPPEVTLPPEPTLPPRSPGRGERLVTVTGEVTAGVEAGCLVLDRYQLVGADGVRPGDVVRVSGVERPGLMTTCQQGVPLEVQRVDQAP